MALSQSYRRRVQLVGGSTLIVSLPKEWARRIGIGPGSEVIVEVLPDGTLHIVPESLRRSERPAQAVVRVPRDPDINTVVREVISYYLAGYKTIKLVFEEINESVVEEIVSNIQNHVMGLEVLEEDGTSITFHSVIDVRFMDLWSVVKRLSRVSLSMLEDLEKCISGCDVKLLENLVRRDNLVDKLYLLVIKQLTEALSRYDSGSDILPAEAMHIAMVAKCIERIADHATGIAKILLETGQGIEVSKEILGLYREAVELFRQSIDSFTGLDRARAIEIARRVDEVKSREKELRKELEAYRHVYLRLLMDGIRRILAYSVDIAEAVLDVTAIRSAIASR